MKKYEKQLKQLHTRFFSSGNEYMFTDEFKNISENDFRYLSARHLIELKGYYDNRTHVLLTDDGVVYFDDKAYKRTNFLTNSIIAPLIVALLVSLLTILLATGTPTCDCQPNNQNYQSSSQCN
jgi:hypothetical protein